MQSAELNLAQVEASIAASDTPSSATIAQDEAAVKQAAGDGRRRREGARGDRAHRPDRRHGHRGQRRGRLDGERGRVHGERRRPELLERVLVLVVELADRRRQRYDVLVLVRFRHDRLAAPTGGRGGVRRGGRGRPQRRAAGDADVPGAHEHRGRRQGHRGLELLHRRQQRRHLRRHDRARQPAGRRQAGHDHQRQRRDRDEIERARAPDARRSRRTGRSRPCSCCADGETTVDASDRPGSSGTRRRRS